MGAGYRPKGRYAPRAALSAFARYARPFFVNLNTNPPRRRLACKSHTNLSPLLACNGWARLQGVKRLAQTHLYARNAERNQNRGGAAYALSRAGRTTFHFLNDEFACTAKFQVIVHAN